MLSFNFAGKDSFEDMGIYMANRPSIPTPRKRITNILIPGKSSSLKIDENTYEDITLAIECSIKDKEIPNRIDEIVAWLNRVDESDLIFSFQKEKKYIAQVVNTIDFTQVLRYFSKFIIVFNCRPFKYDVKNSIVTIAGSDKLVNPGSIHSEPILNVLGSGNITLKINEETITLFDVGGQIVIDSITQNCYNDNLENLNNKMNGEFPKLKVGENTIQCLGSVSKVEVSPNWRWL